MNGHPPALRRPARALWAAAFLALFAPFAVLAVTEQGMIWADEIFQTMEQAHRLAFGYGLVPWEFQQGARFWLLPALLALPMRAMGWLGLDSGRALVITTKLLCALATASAFFLGVRLADRLGGRAAALLMGLLAVSFPATLLYGHRALSEVLSAPVVMGMVVLLVPAGLDAATARSRTVPVGRSHLIAAGVLGGLLVLVRYQNALLLPFVVLLVALRHRVRAALWVAGLALAVLALGGLADYWLWGRPFHSLIAYLGFNLGSGGADQWGISPPSFFPRVLLATTGVPLFVLLAGFAAGLPRLWPVAVLVLAFLGAHSLVPHKELRFLFPVLPLFLLVAALGIGRLLARLRPRRAVLGAAALGLALALLMSARARSLTFADIGQPMNPFPVDGPRGPSVWGAFAETNHLLWQAGRRSDLCGLAVVRRNAYWSGGYSYLHRRVPLMWQGDPAQLAAANYLVLAPGTPLPDMRYRHSAEVAGFQLLRREGGCQAPPAGAGRFGRMLPEGVPGS